MRRLESWLVVLACVLLVAVLSHYYHVVTPLRHMDTVLLFETSRSVSESGLPTSRTVASWPLALRTFTTPVDVVCQSDLKIDWAGTYNIFRNHAYVALYPISLFTLWVSPEFAFATLNAFAHILMLVLPFMFLRRQGLGVPASLAFVACVAFYPAWSYSALGDYYLDRLYMPFALLSLYLMHGIVRGDAGTKRRTLLIGFLGSVIAAALFTERAALMMFGVIAFHMLFFPRILKIVSIRNVMLGLFIFLTVYLGIFFVFFFEGIDGGGGLLHNTVGLSQRLQEPRLLAFALSNLLVLGLFVAFSGSRYPFLAFGAMIPNLLITVGGAELNGWPTHYHTMYMPFLIFVASVGYLRLSQQFNSGTSRIAFPLLVGAYVLLVGNFLNPFMGRFESGPNSTVKDGVLAKLVRYYHDPQRSWERATANALGSLDALIPRGAKVSGIEGVMPVLYRSRYLSLYPIGMDDADYLVISGTASDGRVTSISGAPSYLGTAESESLNRCLANRLIKSGFRFLEAVPAVGVLIFKRVASN